MRSILVAFLLLALQILPAEAQQVIINGKRLTPAEYAWLANYSCGPVPAGSYWINLQTGQWGYAGSARIMGHVRDRCRRPSLSERRRLYRPGEILSGN